MANTDIVTLDLNFQNSPHAIACYLVKHSTGAILVECGPGSTREELKAGLARLGLSPSHVTHVLLTHIHLDHAGAAGWLARQGAQIFVHPAGAPHLVNPERLLASARRIYGDKMDQLWGEFLAVPESSITVPQDEQEIDIGGRRFVPINTPGHAEHHYAYLFEGTCFSGDVGGVRVLPHRYLRVPMPPPELNLEKWRRSLARLRQEAFERIAPTHFGIHPDPEWQLQAVERGIDRTERWMEHAMQEQPALEALRAAFEQWMDGQGREENLSEHAIEAYRLANPPGMSADGLLRYWTKVRAAN
jgi:glyoxylase-like metal-dependent hydrolase (beta-lactamase superfamily II)